MGKVYEAVVEKPGITYALKMIRHDRVGLRYVERFRREARTMSDLDHPSIARIYGYGEIEDGQYFTVKYLLGGTLADRLADVRGHPHKVVSTMIKVASAVHYLHMKNYIRRDRRHDETTRRHAQRRNRTVFAARTVHRALATRPRSGRLLCSANRRKPMRRSKSKEKLFD